MTNFNIDELRRQIEAVIRNNPDVFEDDERLKLDTLEGATDMFSALMQLFDASSDAAGLINAMTQRMASLQERRARYARRVEVLRGLMLSVLQSADVKRIELPDATLSQRNTQPQLVGEIDVNTLPDDLCTIKREPNRTAIRKALLDQREVPGVWLSNSEPGLMVRVK
jgi:hypothetical protein